MTLSKPTVICDAYVFFGFTLRDILISLAKDGFFKAKWTKEIETEWTSNLNKKHPEISLKSISSIKNLMRIAILDWEVTHYKKIIPKLNLPDSDDRHVLSAAIQAKANYIISFNSKDFPISELDKFSIRLLNPDDFLVELALREDSFKFLKSLKKYLLDFKGLLFLFRNG